MARFDAESPVEGYVDGYLERFRVAERDGLVLGIYHLEGDHLHAIHVDVPVIGSGVGRALMDDAEAAGARKLEVRKFNNRARAFYAKRGWVEAEEYSDTEMGFPVQTLAMKLI